MKYIVLTILLIHVHFKTYRAESEDDEEVDSCDNKQDGLYAMRDYSKFMSCLHKLKTVLSCEDGFIFKADLRECVQKSLVTKENFCHSRENGDYLNPWTDCRKYIHCVFGWTDVLECEQGFYYDPDTDTCKERIGNEKCTYPTNNSTNTTNSTNPIVDQSESNNINNQNQSDIDLITPAELKSKLQTGDVRLIDVRHPWELKAQGRIAQSINIPLNEVNKAFKDFDSKTFKSVYHIEKPSQDDCNLVFHCKSGVRSYAALQIVVAIGYKCPKSLKGGFNAWKLMLP